MKAWTWILILAAALAAYYFWLRPKLAKSSGGSIETNAQTLDNLSKMETPLAG